VVDLTAAEFEELFTQAEPRLRRALVAAFGGERVREALAEAMAWAWQHWEHVPGMANPAGYLYRVGRSRTRGLAAPGAVSWVHRRRDALGGARPPSGFGRLEPATPGGAGSGPRLRLVGAGGGRPPGGGPINRPKASRTRTYNDGPALLPLEVRLPHQQVLMAVAESEQEAAAPAHYRGWR
jgi:hypothetical protein